MKNADEIYLYLAQKARERLDKGKWIKGAEDNGYGAHCAIGFVRKAAIEEEKVETTVKTPAFTGYVDDMSTLLVKDDPVVEKMGGGYNVESFNDDEKTRKRDVVALFDRFIKRQEKKLAQS